MVVLLKIVCYNLFMESFPQSNNDGRKAEREFGDTLNETAFAEKERREKLWKFLSQKPNSLLDAPEEELAELIEAAKEHKDRLEMMKSGQLPGDGIPREPWVREIIEQLIREGERKKEAA